ncbi:MAG: DUF2203 domain-containing protein [Deltaproteobacteria bacterium]|nr:DUF2203 domain-containing protein [Deltaproteobacteria bacterium]
MRKERLFTVDEVNALIPRLEAIIEQLQRKARIVREQVREVSGPSGQAADIDTAKILEQRPALRGVLGEIEKLVDEIESCGGEFKGIDLGLIDFEAERDGEIVLLCWQYGEKEVTHYHTPEDGFAGRKPLDPHIGRPRYLQ